MWRKMCKRSYVNLVGKFYRIRHTLQMLHPQDYHLFRSLQHFLPDKTDATSKKTSRTILKKFCSDYVFANKMKRGRDRTRGHTLSNFTTNEYYITKSRYQHVGPEEKGGSRL